MGMHFAYEMSWIMFLGSGVIWCMALTCWVCRFMQAALKLGQWGEMEGNFSQSRYSVGLGAAHWGIGRLPWDRGPVCHRVWFCLMLYLLLYAKKRGGGISNQGLFPGQTCPSCHAAPGFPQLLDSIKRCFKHCSLNFMCTLCVGGYLVD
jgi:hypothetical protein